MPSGVLVITGPTATGKTGLGVQLARRLNGEVVSADSMQIYKGMDIGTATPNESEKAGVKHHMLDIIEPWEEYSVSRYVEDASRCVDDILSRGRLPVIVGGTGLYIDSLLSGRSFMGGDAALREEFSRRYDEEGGAALLRELQGVDPESAARLHINDKKRIVRALEVFFATGKSITRHNEETKAATPRYNYCKIALNYSERSRLYERINLRVDEMMAQGLLDEVRRLIESGVKEDSTAMQAIGYKEAVLALRGEISEKEAAEDIKQASRRYAKRQLSWLSGKDDVNWILWENEPNYAQAYQISTRFMENNGIIVEADKI